MSWPTQQLGELCEFKGGLWTGKKPPFTKAKVLRITNFTKGCELDVTDAIELDVEERQLQSRRLVDGDIIIEKSGGGPNQPVGRVALCADLDGVYSFSNFTTALRINDRRKIEPKFLHQYLKTLYFRGDTEAMQSNSTNLRNLNLDAYRAIKVPIPPIPEQQRIVGKLDAAFAALTEAQAHVERNRANARELFESYLNGVFEGKGDGWEERELGTICEVKDGTHDSPRYLAEGIPFVTQKNVTVDGLSLTNTRYISQEDHDNFYRRSNAAYGDILISMIGANRGMACLIDDRTVFSIKNVCLVKSSENINERYLLAYLKSTRAAEFVRSKSKGGAQEFIGLTELRKFPIIVPTRRDQDTLADKFDALRRESKSLEATYQQKLTELTGLKKAVLGAAFRGEL